jgi:ribosomal protein S18 acetylase RimI-like enzyme
VIEYQTFRNADPPQVLKLWNDSQLSRGAARPQSVEAFETSVFAQQHFDPLGFIVAVDRDEIVGFVHAGFAPAPGTSQVDRSVGIICAVVVHPKVRRQGVGRELMSRAIAYLKEREAVRILAGESPGADPFYFGLYGGCRPSGFLKSEAVAEPFLRAMGFAPHEEHTIYQRDLRLTRDPISFRTMKLRRITQLEFTDQPANPTWWWYANHGMADSLQCQLTDRDHHQFATLTVVGLDHYVAKWEERAIGLLDLDVTAAYRGQGYGQTLVVEVVRKMKQEMITRAEMHVPAGNTAAHRIAAASGFQAVDTGVVYALP